MAVAATRITSELLEAARSVGIEVREPGGKGECPPRSGLVHLKGRPVLFLERGVSEGDLAELLARALADFDLDNLYLSPAARELVGRYQSKRES